MSRGAAEGGTEVGTGQGTPVLQGEEGQLSGLGPLLWVEEDFKCMNEINGLGSSVTNTSNSENLHVRCTAALECTRNSGQK